MKPQLFAFRGQMLEKTAYDRAVRRSQEAQKEQEKLLKKQQEDQDKEQLKKEKELEKERKKEEKAQQDAQKKADQVELKKLIPVAKKAGVKSIHMYQKAESLREAIEKVKEKKS